MNKNIFSKYKNIPIDQSITLVAKELAGTELLVAVSQADPEDLQFHVAPDKQGKLWTYVFTDLEEFSKAFPSGSAFIGMSLVDLLATVGPDGRFGGIMVNSKSDGLYTIPSDFFGFVYKFLTETPNQKAA